MKFQELLEQSKEGTDVGLVVLTHSEFKRLCPYHVLGSDRCTDGSIEKACEVIECRYVNAKFKEDQHEEA